MKFISQCSWHRAFLAGIVLKGLDGILELAGGTALLLTTRPAVSHIIARLTHGELVEDPNDFFSNLLVRTAHDASIQSQHFAGAYLVGHGIVKIGLAVGLLRGLLWMYPLALCLLTALVAYQSYRFAHTHSIPLCFFTAVDCVILLLIWREWQQARTC